MKQNQNKRDSSIMDGYYQEQIDQAFNFLVDNSKGKGFVVDLKTDRQQLFTSTQQQFDSDDYPKNQQDSLEHDFVFLPMVGKTLQTGGSLTKAISPSVFNGGKRVMQNANKIDDDVGRYIDYYRNQVPHGNKIFSLDTFESALPYSTPSVNFFGAIGVGISKTIEYKDDIKDKVNEVLNDLK